MDFRPGDTVIFDDTICKRFSLKWNKTVDASLDIVPFTEYIVREVDYTNGYLSIILFDGPWWVDTKTGIVKKVKEFNPILHKIAVMQKRWENRHGRS